MKSEFTLAFNEITERFGLSRDTVMEALEAAMVSAYRRSVNASSAQAITAKIDPETGAVAIYAEKEIVDEVENPLTEVSFEVARKVDGEVQLGDMLLVESTPRDFGRVAAQTAKQVILQRLREAERDAQYEEFIEREGDMVHGTVHSITPQAVTVGLGRAEAILPRNQQIPGERFHVRDRVRVYVLEVRKSSRGPVIVVSRTHPNMLRRLLEMEVPEIGQGLVEIMAIAREAGKRAKVAVAATRDGVDPVGACVGLRGVRIQSIVRDLNDEKIDVIEWNPSSATFIAKALSPARVSGVYLDENLERGKTALVVVPEDQLSLAIGRAGVNARLAARLTGWRIDIKSLIEATMESLQKLEDDEAYQDLAKLEAETVPKVHAILTKKSETRPVTPEEYQLLTSFVDRVQGEIESRRDARKRILEGKLAEVRATIPPTAYEVPLEEVGLSTRVHGLMVEADFSSAGQILEQLGVDEDEILKLPGVGPKTIEELKEKLNAYPYPQPEPEPAVEVEAEAVEAEVEEVVAEAAEVEAAPEEAPVEAQEVEAMGAVEAPISAPQEAPVMETVEVEGEPAAVTEEQEAAVEAEAVPGFSLEAIVPMVEDIGVIETEDFTEEEELKEGKERKKRKVKSRVVEYDPDSGETVVRKRRKPSRKGEWDEYDR